MTSYTGVVIPLAKTPYRNTKVASDKSQTEIRALLGKYDVEDTQFTYMRDHGIRVKFARPSRDGHLAAYQLTASRLTADEQGERQAMRFLYQPFVIMPCIDWGVAEQRPRSSPNQSAIALALAPSPIRSGTPLQP